MLAAAPARAELRIDITRGKVEPMPIAIPPFAGGGDDEARSARDIAGSSSADLERSGLFRPLDPRSFIQNVSAGEAHRASPIGARSTPRRWSPARCRRRATAGSGSSSGCGTSFAEQQLAGFAYTTTRQNWRRIAHIIADEIYKRITGEDGYFDTRIVYIAEIRAGARSAIKRLAIMDQDGANHHYLTDGRALVLTPRFSPSAQEITYLSYASGTPRVYLFNIDTGQQEVARRFPRHDLRAALLARRQPASSSAAPRTAPATSIALDLRTPPG